MVDDGGEAGLMRHLSQVGVERLRILAGRGQAMAADEREHDLLGGALFCCWSMGGLKTSAGASSREFAHLGVPKHCRHFGVNIDGNGRCGCCPAVTIPPTCVSTVIAPLASVCRISVRPARRERPGEGVTGGRCSRPGLRFHVCVFPGTQHFVLNSVSCCRAVQGEFLRRSDDLVEFRGEGCTGRTVR